MIRPTNTNSLLFIQPNIVVAADEQLTTRYRLPVLGSKAVQVPECLSHNKAITTTSEMSYFLPHLPSGWHVDEAIKSEEDRVVVIRFGHDWDSQCMMMDETLYSVAEKVQNFAVIYLVDITEVPDFNKVTENNWLSTKFLLTFNTLKL